MEKGEKGNSIEELNYNDVHKLIFKKMYNISKIAASKDDQETHLKAVKELQRMLNILRISIDIKYTKNVDDFVDPSDVINKNE